jgi:hypothetical protein
MIEPSGRVDKALGIDLRKVYKSIANVSIKSVENDQINISQFSSLVEKTRAQALELPSIRMDRVRQIKADLAAGKSAQAGDIASAMINNSSEIRECKE